MVVLIPGLGADERLFEGYLFPGYPVTVLPYIEPLKDEFLAAYAKRLRALLPAASSYILIGVSFGGLLALELSALLPARQVILISSIKSASESPAYFSWLQKFPVYRWLPYGVLRYLFILLGILFTKKSPSERKLFESMVKQSNKGIIRWGIHQVVHWQPTAMPGNLFHIHGSRDLVFPIRRIRADAVIEGAQHFMIVSHRPRINELLLVILSGKPLNQLPSNTGSR